MSRTPDGVSADGEVATSSETGAPTPLDVPAVPDVSVTIVTYECRDLVLDCIAALRDAASACTYEVIVADNGSTDGTVGAVTAADPLVRVIEVGFNNGFGRSHNLAASAARGRYLLVLNPDTIPAAGSLDELVDFADRSTEPVGVVSPQLLNPDGTDQRTARSFPTASAGIFGRRSPLTRWFPNNRWSLRFLEPEARGEGEPWPVDWVSGAAMMLPRDYFEEIGGFDPDFFMHFEDAELCARVARSGRRVWCVPAARIVHDEGGSRGGWPAAQVFHFHRGAYLFAKKSRYPGSIDPRRWGIALLLGTRAAATMGVNQVRRVVPRQDTERKEGERRKALTGQDT